LAHQVLTAGKRKMVAKTESRAGGATKWRRGSSYFYKGWIIYACQLFCFNVCLLQRDPDYLRQSMQSIYDQTVPTDDFVLVCDGPLTPELDAVIADMSAAIRTAPERLPSFEKWRPR
jgi:hypothetical protein